MTSVPAAISKLKLKWAFKDIPKPIEAFYTVTHDKEFYIEDDILSKKTVVVQTPNEDKFCKVLNNNNTEAVVLSIDNALIPHYQGGIADGAVFNINNFVFVEFKTNAQGNTDLAVNATYQKAMKQLKSTIDLFNTHLQKAKVNFTQIVNVECNIIVPATFPRNTASEMTYALQFATENWGIPLNFDNIIEL